MPWVALGQVQNGMGGWYQGSNLPFVKVQAGNGKDTERTSLQGDQGSQSRRLVALFRIDRNGFPHNGAGVR
jgi:hypothetical protein